MSSTRQPDRKPYTLRSGVYMVLPSRLWLSQIAVMTSVALQYLLRDSGIGWLTTLLALASIVSVAIMLALSVIDKDRMWAVYVRARKLSAPDTGENK